MAMSNTGRWGGLVGIGVLAVASALTAQHLDSIDSAASADSPSPASGVSMEQARDQLDELTVQDESEVAGYDRDLFPHWDTGAEGTCTTRQVVLERDGEDVQTDEGCQPISGTWTSLYDGEVLTEAGQVDIDHMVALREAWRSGAHAWTTEERGGFANDLDSTQLWAVSASSNRSKGDSDPADWMPPAEEVHCDYAASWVEVKHTWELTVDPDEEQALRQVLSRC